MRVHIRRKAKSVRPRYVWNNPGTVIDRSGHVVSTKQECWRLNEVTRPVIVNWNGIESAPDIKDSMKAYLAHVIESNAVCANQLAGAHARRPIRMTGRADGAISWKATTSVVILSIEIVNRSAEEDDD